MFEVYEVYEQRISDGFSCRKSWELQVRQVGASLQWGVLSPGAVDAPWLVQSVNASNAFDHRLLLYLLTIQKNSEKDDVLYIQLFNHSIPDFHPFLRPRHWSGIAESMLTLFLSISGGLSWGEALQPLRPVGPTPFIAVNVYIVTGAAERAGTGDRLRRDVSRGPWSSMWSWIETRH